MKFALLVLLAAGALSAPFNSKWETEDILSFDDFKPQAHEFSLFESENSNCGGKLHAGRVYEFNYVGETENKIQGSSPDSTGLQMQAQILIRSASDCTFGLQVRKAALLMKSKNQRTFVPAVESDKFNVELTANELKFKMNGGNIALYPEENEQTHILNIKRGILSTLQLTSQKEEVDVNGRCAVTTELVDGVIVKSKNLAECTERVHNELGFQSTSFEGESAIINPLKSTSVCTYHLTSNGREIQSVECNEMHIFRPFSSGYKTEAGALNIVRQTLKQVKSYDQKETTMKVGEQASLVFDNEKEDLKPVNTIVNEVDQIMHRLVDQSQELGMIAKQDSAHEFTRLVMLLRRLDRKRMVPIWSKYIDCVASKVCEANENLFDVYRQYLLDALTYCGTTTCVTMVHNVIIDKTVTGENMNMFLQGISLVKTPTKGMIRDVTNVVRMRPSRQAYFTLGTLIFRFCKALPEECKYDSASPVTQAEIFLEKQLGQSCEGQENHVRVEEILMTIKAIGNAGRPVHLSSTLLSCAMTSLHQNVSLAAVEALRRMPCKESVSEELLKMIENIDLDPERRIASYVGVMKCPTESSMQRIVSLLESDKSRQLGSFIYTHLTNLNESSNPEHKFTKEILNKVVGNGRLRQVILPKTMYSHAYEGSFYNEYLKAGVAAEGHIIYHPNSYLPRTALLNITGNMLGVSLNVMELAARMEGFETIIEDVFGPDGYYPNNHIMDLFNSTFFNKDQVDILRNRNRRSAANIEDNIVEMHERVNAKRPVPSGHVSMKMFGHEMRLFSYDDIFQTIDEIDNSNVIELLLKLAKGGQKTFTKSVMFLELTHTVPTGLGLPLRVKLLGSAVGSVRVDGKFDIRNMFWGPGSMEMKGTLNPSAVVEISGQMGIHSHFIETGVFVNASMFTSQVMQGSATYKAGQLMKFNIDTPQDQLELFNVSVSPFLYINEDSELVEGTARRVGPSFCLNATKVLGLGICTSFAMPLAYREYEAPFFPLSGPAHFSGKVIRADTKLTTYQWLVSLKKAAAGKESFGQFEFSTPGATYERKFVGQVRYLQSNMYRTFGIASVDGDKKSEVTFSYNNNTNAMEATFESNMWTPKMFKSKVALTNDTFFKTRQIGVKFVTEYDWYKFQHVSMIVNKTSSYMLHSKTTYYPGKHLTGEVEFFPEDKDIQVRFDSNQLNQRIEFHGKAIKTDDATGMKFSAHHLSMDKSATFFIGYTRDVESQRLVLNGTVLGKSAESSIGYYKTVNGKEIRMQINAMGKEAGVFAHYEGSDMNKDIESGLFYGDYRVGAKMTSMKTDKSCKLCSTVFYGVNEPTAVCLDVAYNDASKTNAVLSWRVLERLASLNMDYDVVDNKYKLETSAVYNKNILASQTWELDYNTIWNTQLAMYTVVMGRYFSMKWFTEKPMEHITVLGMEVNSFDKVLRLTSSYHKEISSENQATLHGVIFEAMFNKVKLPANFTVLFENGDDVKGLSAITKFWSYEAKKNIAWLKPKDDEHSIVSEMSVKKHNDILLSRKETWILVIGKLNKALKYIHNLNIYGYKSEYGWDMVYHNSTTISKTAHALTMGLTYSKGRRVSTTLTLATGEKACEILMDVEYLPGKQVTHSITYDRKMQQIKATMEFLPKMFVMVTGTADRTEGFKITSDLEFSWNKFNRVFHYAGGVANKTDLYKLFSRFSAYGHNVVAIAEFNKISKTGGASLSLNGKAIRLTFNRSPSRKAIALSYLEKTLIEAIVESGNGRCVVEVGTPSKTYVKSIAKKDAIHGIYSHELVVVGKSLLLNEFHYKKVENTVAYHVSTLGVKRFEAVAKYDDLLKTVFLHGSLMKTNWDLGLAGKWDEEKSTVTVSAEALGKVTGFIVRVHPSKMITSFHVFYQKQIISGFHAFIDKDLKAIVFNTTVTPRISGQVVFEVLDDHVIKTTFQRKEGGAVVNETSFSYTLTPSESQFMVQWNKDTITALKNVYEQRIVPAWKNAAQWSVKTSSWAREATVDATCTGKDFIASLVKNSTSAFLKATNSMDKAFDMYDFVAARDNVGAMLISILKRSSELSFKSFNLMTHYLELANQHTPYVMDRTRVYGNLLWDRSTEAHAIVFKIAKNLTESSKPVVNMAIKLVKEFKLRGKTFEVIVTELLALTNKTITDVTRRATAEGKVYMQTAMKKLVESKIPYTDKKFGETFKAAMEKVREQTNNFDVAHVTKKVTVVVLQYKIDGKTVEEHWTTACGMLKELPQRLRIKYALLMKEATEKYDLVKDEVLEKYIMVKVFATPLLDHLKQVNASMYKRFGPVYAKAINSIYRNVVLDLQSFVTKAIEEVKVYSSMKYKSGLEFFVPLTTPFGPYAETIISDLRALEVSNKKIGEIVDQLINIIRTKMTDTIAMSKMYVKKTLDTIDVNMMSFDSMYSAETMENAKAYVLSSYSTLLTKAQSHYNNVDMYKANAMTKANELKAKLTTLITLIMKYNPTEVADLVLSNLGNGFMETTTELAKITKQLSNFDLANPTWKLWKDIDIINHLGRYGVNGFIADAIMQAKNGNITVVILNIVDMLQSSTLATFHKSVGQINRNIELVKKLHSIIRAIPKKTYDEFYADLMTVLVNTKNYVSRTAMTTYDRSVKSMRKMIDSTNASYIVMYEKYVVPTSVWYNAIKNSGVMVYDDNKDDTVRVYNFYKDIIVDFYKVKADMYKQNMNIKVEQAMKMYEDFISQYDYLTWEEIGENTMTYATEKSVVAKKMYETEKAKMTVVAQKLKSQLETLYKDLTVKGNKAVLYLNTTVRIEAMRRVNMMLDYVKTMYAKCQLRCNEMYVNIKDQSLAWYNDNKAKSIHKFYTEAKMATVDFCTAKYNHYDARARQILNEMNMKVRQQYAVIMPEVLKEAESILNQTLHASVAMANVTVESFYPHYSIVKDHGIKYSQVIAQKARELAAQSVAMAKERGLELYGRYPELLETLKEHPMVQRIKGCQYIKNMTVNYEILVVELEKKIELLKEQIRVWKSHPNVLKLQQKLQEYKLILEAYIEKIKEYRNHPRVVSALEVAALAKQSAMYTWNKIKPELMSLVEQYKMQGEYISALSTNYASQHAVMFRQQPAECFWTNIQNAKTLLSYFKSQYDDLPKVNRDAMIVKLNEYYNEYTDEWVQGEVSQAKTMAKDMYVEYKEKAMQSPAYMKAYLKEKMETLKTMTLEKYNKMSTDFERCPMQGFIKNQIWSEISEEMKDMLMVEDVKAMAVEYYALLKINYLKYKQIVTEQALAKKEKLISKYNTMITKYNEMLVKTDKFLKETTLEHIVVGSIDKATELAEKVEAFKIETMKKVESYMMKVDMYKAQMNNTMRQYVAEARVFLADAKMTVERQAKVLITKIDTYYPVSSVDYRGHYMNALAKLIELKEKIIKYIQELKVKSIVYAREMKIKASTKALELWTNSAVRSNLVVLKKMTVRETIDTTKKMMKELPVKVQKLATELKQKATLKMNEVKAVMEPTVAVVTQVVSAVANEVNETAVFVYRFYGLKEKTLSMINCSCTYARNYVAATLPKISMFVRSASLNATDSSLRYFHRSLVAMDRFDYTQHIPDYEMYALRMKDNVNSYVSKIAQYIDVDVTEGKVVLRLPHPRTVKPTFTENFKVVDAAARMYVDKINQTAQRIVLKTKEQAQIAAWKIMNVTAEVRSDMRQLYFINKEAAIHFYGVGSVYGKQVMAMSSVAYQKYSDEAKIESMKAYNLMKQYSTVGLNKANAIFNDIYFESKSWTDVYTKSAEYYTLVNSMVRTQLTEKYNVIESEAKQFYAKQQTNFNTVVAEAKPYYQLMKASIEKFRQGEKFETAFAEIMTYVQQYQTVIDTLEMYQNELRMKAESEFNKLIQRIETQYPETWQILQDYKTLHMEMLEKYGAKAIAAYRFSKVKVERFVRHMGYKCMGVKQSVMRLTPTRKSVAMIFGYNHVMTFDNKFFEFPSYINKQCTYLLASDFHQRNFTVLSQSDALIIMTPDMKVTIRQNGQVESVIRTVKKGYSRQQTFKGLPVQSASGVCKKTMKASIITCSFDQGVKIFCDPEHFVCSIELSGFNYGKSKGILGTNNNEQYDDFTTPDGVITSSVNKLAASWEVTGDAACSDPSSTNLPSACNQAPSRRCKELFSDNTSQLSSFFNNVDPKPFMKACAIDSSDCAHNTPYSMSHCNATAAYIGLLRMKGYHGASTPKDCMSYTTEDKKIHNIMERWVQPATKEVDISVLVSERNFLQGNSKTYAQMLYAMNKALEYKGFSMRYSMIGYGGHGVHEKPHFHTLAGSNFNNIVELADTLKSMPYTGIDTDMNDPMYAIVMASKLTFRPGAARVFIVLDSGIKSQSDVSFDEASYALRYEANASLFVFDNFAFKANAKGKVIGQTLKRVFTEPYYKPWAMTGPDFPEGNLADLAKMTNGGVFSNKIKPSDVKTYSTVLSDAVYPRISANTRSCKRCTLVPSWIGSTPVCTDDQFLTC